MTADIDYELRIGFLIHDISRLRRSMVDRVVRPLGVTRSQWWVLAFLSRQDGMHQVALADQLDLGKVALGGIIEGLESNGLIERRPDANDKRLKRVFLSKKGVRMIARIRENVADVEKRLLRGIDASDLEGLVRGLRSMKGNLLDILGRRPGEEEGADT
jgi:DNA-binding MarR family transcriptional regulator